MAQSVAIDMRDIQVVPFFKHVTVEDISASEREGHAVMKVREVVEVQEHAETARRAVEMQAASAQYAARLQEFARTGRMPPPGPAEVAVMARPASDASHPRNAADAFWQTMSDTAGKVAVASTVALFAATLGPPLLDRFGRWLDARAAR